MKNTVLSMLKIALLGAVTLFLLSCGDEQPVASEETAYQPVKLLADDVAAALDRPNILLITIDTLRWDHLGCYGNTEVRTPTIDYLASKGVRYEFFTAHNTITLPSHSNILTGTDPRVHGVHDNFGFTVKEESVTVAEVMQANGYATGAFVSASVLDSQFNLDQGFQVYDDEYGESKVAVEIVSEREGEDTINRSIEWLDQQQTPWFTWVHLYDPHTPYNPPGTKYDEEFANNMYAGEITYVDYHIGRLIDHLKKNEQLDDTFIIVTADHGEGLGDHGEMFHGLLAYNSTLRVPYIMYAPKVLPAGAVVGGRHRHIDIAPTIYQAAGVDIPPVVDGVSLFETLESPTPIYRDSYFESLSGHFSDDWAPLRGIFEGKWKFFDLPLPELYDMGGDPREIRNVVENRAAEGASMRERIEEIVAEGGYEISDRKMEEMDEEMIRKLANLGYITNSPTERKEEYGPEDDPKNNFRMKQQRDRVNYFFMADRPAKAIDVLLELQEKDPETFDMFSKLARAYVEAGQPEKALETIEAGRAADQYTREEKIVEAMAHRDLGDYQPAIALLSAVQEEDPENAEAAHQLALTYTRSGDLASAESAFKRALSLESAGITVFSNYGWMLLEQDRYDEAFPQFIKATDMRENHAPSMHGLGLIYEHRGQQVLAVDHYEVAASAVRPRHLAMLQLGLLLTKMERWQDAANWLAEFVKTAPRDEHGDKIERATNLLNRLIQEIGVRPQPVNTE